MGKPLIMGRKTWESLGRPLPGRLNLVVSRQPGLMLSGAEVLNSLEDALLRAEQWARKQDVDELMLIGGAQLYEQALSYADRLYLTRVAVRVPGDAFFPAIREQDWQLIGCSSFPAEGDKPAYRFETWLRK